MAKKRSRVEDDIASVFDHWAISEKAKEHLARRFLQEGEQEEPAEPSPKQKPLEPSPEKSPQVTPSQSESLSENRPPKSDPQNLTLKNRGSKSDPQKQRVKNRGSKIEPLKRTFRNRPSGDGVEGSSELIDNIPKRHFFSYYNALHDQVLPQVPKNGRLLLSVLFRHSYGFNRNWCRINFPDLQKATGCATNTLREGLRGLIEGGWVSIVSDGFHEATTYLLRIQADLREEEGEELDPQNLTLKNRPSKIDPQNLTQSPSIFEGQKSHPSMSSVTSSTCTGHITGQKPDFHRPEVEHGSVQLEKFEAGGENRVKGNLALKAFPLEEQIPTPSPTPAQGSLSDLEEAYIRSRPSEEQGDIFDAQDAWDEVLGKETRPGASKLNEMLDYLRALGYRGDTLISKFRGCLEKTKGRANDPVGWMISALRKGRYP